MVAQILQTLLAAGLLLSTVIATALTLFLHWPVALAVAVALALPLLIHALCLLVGFVIAKWVGRHAELPASARLTRSGGLIGAWLAECRLAWLSFLVRQPFFGNRKLASASGGKRTPVLLVHGHMCNRAFWRPFARWLAARGHPVASVNLEPIFAPLDRHTERVQGELRRLLREARTDRAILIGHSMGGIVARAYLRDYGDDRVAHLVTIGSPNRGTWFARFNGQTNVRQMRPGSRFLTELAEHEDRVGLPPCTVALSLHDNVVTPQADQILRGARILAWQGYGHIQLAMRPDVWKAIMLSAEPGESQGQTRRHSPRTENATSV